MTRWSCRRHCSPISTIVTPKGIASIPVRPAQWRGVPLSGRYGRARVRDRRGRRAGLHGARRGRTCCARRSPGRPRRGARDRTARSGDGRAGVGLPAALRGNATAALHRALCELRRGEQSSSCALVRDHLRPAAQLLHRRSGAGSAWYARASAPRAHPVAGQPDLLLALDELEPRLRRGELLVEHRRDPQRPGARDPACSAVARSRCRAAGSTGRHRLHLLLRELLLDAHDVFDPGRGPGRTGELSLP